MISIKSGTVEEEILVITRKQTKLYPNPTEEKKRLEETRVKIEKATQEEKSQFEGHYRYLNEELRRTKHHKTHIKN